MERFVGRRSRVERVSLTGAHPVRWFCLSVLTSLLLILAAYLGFRAAYPQQVRDSWPKPIPHLYELWKNDLGTGVRDAVLTFGLVLFLYAFRRWRQAVLVRRPGPIEVSELINATGDEALNTKELAAAFRTVLGRVNLNSPAAVPGAGRPIEFLELLRGAANEKSILGMIAGLLGLTWVSHAYSVTAVLRKRDDPATPVGITVSVVTLPRGGTPPHTVWASDWFAAVDQAAMAVGAAILPLTKLCRRPPWAGWRGLALPPELFGAYLEAKTFTAQRRYDEALGTFYRALELDPLNLHIRLEIGTLEEQLQLFLDALETYDDVIALGSRADERLMHAWSDRLLHWWTVLIKGPKQAALQSEQRAWHPLGDGWRGRRGKRGIRPPAGVWRSGDRHRALGIARYRYAMVLGFSEVVVAQWLRGAEENRPTRRDPERERLRAKLLPRMSHYTFAPFLGDPDKANARTVLLNIMPDHPDSPDEVRRLEQIEQRLRGTVGAANRIRKAAPRCDEAHDHFQARFQVARLFVADDRPANSRTLDKVAKSLIAASDLCADKDWSKIRADAEQTLPELRPAPVRKLTALDILWAQELFQAASLTEIEQLQRDYRWFRGRRRRNHPISASAVRVSVVLAQLRQRRIHALIWSQMPASERGDSLRGPITWPPPLGQVSLRVARALGRNPLAVHDWQDFYNAACVFAMLLLPNNNWAGLHLGHRLVQPPSATTDVDAETRNHRTAEHAVRALERAIDTSDSSFAAGQRSWLAFEDPDLVGFRARPEFVQFRGRNLTSADFGTPLPKNVHVLQLSAYVTEILRSLASTQFNSTTAKKLRLLTPVELSAWLDLDRKCWQLLAELTLEYRDWRSRLQALHFIIELAGQEVTRSPAIPYPSFPDPRIGDMKDVSSGHDVRCINLAARYARQERDDQFSRLRSIVLSGRPGRQSTEESSQESGHLLHMQLSAAEITTFGIEAVLAAGAQRLLAWEHLYDCLSTKYFTDDKSLLRERKLREERFEAELAHAVAGSQLPPSAREQPETVIEETATAGT